jgi:hypothetical protein
MTSCSLSTENLQVGTVRFACTDPHLPLLLAVNIEGSGEHHRRTIYLAFQHLQPNRHPHRVTCTMLLLRYPRSFIARTRHDEANITRVHWQIDMEDIICPSVESSVENITREDNRYTWYFLSYLGKTLFQSTDCEENSNLPLVPTKCECWANLTFP